MTLRIKYIFFYFGIYIANATLRLKRQINICQNLFLGVSNTVSVSVGFVA